MDTLQQPPRQSRPEVGASVRAHGIETNYLEAGAGEPVVLVHGSGPGVSAYANWRLTLPALAEGVRVFAPDLVGFGFTERPPGVRYDLGTWTDQLLGFLDAVGIERASIVGNSFGGAIALSLAARHPDRVDRLVLMGSVGVSFPITEGLDAVWGYQPSFEAMRRILDYFAYSRDLVDDELAEVRYQASIQPGFQESYGAMFPAPRQRWVDAMVTADEQIAALPHRTLVVHGREDQVIPLANAHRLLELIPDAELHVFGRCGHWSQIEHADAFNRLVLDFLTAP
ncbi:MAG: alpha/beta fold hydrolase [Nocardioides sp.]